jgi:hypothetical protein
MLCPSYYLLRRQNKLYEIKNIKILTPLCPLNNKVKKWNLGQLYIIKPLRHVPL